MSHRQDVGAAPVTGPDFFQRWRVRIGYVLAAIILVLARPTATSLALGAVVGAIGLATRAYAAGFLHKQEILTTTGPYAYTRNPLYLGSSILAVGAGIATHSWIAAVLLLFYFALIYRLVMRREEMELRTKHGSAFDAYAARVPLFFPGLTASLPQPSAEAPSSPNAAQSSPHFTWDQYKRNHEYQAAFGFLVLLVILSVLAYFYSR